MDRKVYLPIFSNYLSVGIISADKSLFMKKSRRPAYFPGNVMRRSEHLVTAGTIELREPASVKGTYKRRYSSLDGQRHCGDVCGHVRRRTVDDASWSHTPATDTATEEEKSGLSSNPTLSAQS